MTLSEVKSRLVSICIDENVVHMYIQYNMYCCFIKVVGSIYMKSNLAWSQIYYLAVCHPDEPRIRAKSRLAALLSFICDHKSVFKDLHPHLEVMCWHIMYVHDVGVKSHLGSELLLLFYIVVEMPSRGQPA